MSPLRAGQVLLLLSALAICPTFASRTHRAPTSGHSHRSSTRKAKRTKASRIHGQRVIDSNRAAEIQKALVQQKYLSGAPSGQWDAQTQVAMRQYQSDHGWQTKLMPDSRALISLGLGPNPVDAPVAGHAVAGSASHSQAEPGTQTQSTEPAENTLASVHSLTQ